MALVVVELITVRFEIEARVEVNVSMVPAIARNTFEKNDVDVAFVVVEFVALKLTDTVFVANALVAVAFVVVELITFRLAISASIDVKVSIEPNTVLNTVE